MGSQGWVLACVDVRVVCMCDTGSFAGRLAERVAGALGKWITGVGGVPRAVGGVGWIIGDRGASRRMPSALLPATLLRPRRALQAKHYTLWRVVVDALAAGMLVTCLLDFWRIGLGGIVEGEAGSGGVPWVH